MMDKKLNKEIIGIKQNTEKQAVSQTKDLLKVYRRNLDNVRDQIAKIYARYTVDGKLNISTQQRYSILHDLERQLVKQMQELGDDTVRYTSNITIDIFQDTFAKTAYIIDKGTQVFTDFAMLKPEFVKACVNAPIQGKTFSTRIWDNVNALAKRIKIDVEKALIQGQSVEKLARKIKSDFGSTAYQAKKVINTETARAVSNAQNQIYKNSEVVHRVMWDSTLESNTCSECGGLDGQIWEINETHPIPPLHPNCRCCLIPVVDGWKPKTKLENEINPQTGEKLIIDYTTFDKWKESKNI